MAKRAARDFVPFEEGTDFDGDDVQILGWGSTADGTRGAVMLPRSLERLGDEARLEARQLQRLGFELQRVADEIDEAVERCRSAGVSWSGIGWCLGTTGEASRQRWGP